MPVVGGTEDLELSGWDEAPADGPVFALGDVDADADVRFAARGGGRLIAPADAAGLWRRAPWPAHDALFELPPADDQGAVLVVAPEAERIAGALRHRGAAAQAPPRLTRDALRQASVVVLIDDSALFPRLGFCVLAARRVLVTIGGDVTFGLQSGIEFLGVPALDEAVERANMARLHPRAMDPLRVMGARAAREHRASLVYPRLTADLPSVA